MNEAYVATQPCAPATVSKGARHEGWLAAVAVGICAVAMLTVYLGLAWYAQPAADDFFYAVRLRDKGLWEAICYFHTQWSGRYTSNVLYHAWSQFMVWSDFSLYRLAPMVLVLGYVLGLWSLFRQIFVDEDSRNGLALLLAVVGAAFYVSRIAGPHYGTLFWAAGSIGYQVSVVFFLFFLAFFAAAANARSRGQAAGWRLAVCGGFVFLCAGGNEILLLGTLATLSLGLATAWLQGWPSRYQWLGLFCVALAGGVILVLAPGNSQRLTLEVVEYMTPPDARGLGYWLKAARLVAETIGRWATDPALLCGSLIWLRLRLRFFAGPWRSQLFFERWRWILAAVWILVMVSALLVTFFLGWPEPPSRLQTVVHFFFLLGWFACLSAWSARQVGQGIRLSPLFERACLVLFVLGLVLNPHFKEGCNILLSKASGYSQAWQKRRILFVQAKSEGRLDLEVDPLLPEPPILAWPDFTPDANRWTNKAVADYFGLRSVRLRLDTTDPAAVWAMRALRISIARESPPGKAPPKNREGSSGPSGNPGSAE